MVRDFLKNVCSPRLLCCTASTLMLVCGGLAAAAPPDYTRDVRPVFAENCYQCHGPDGGTRQADLRFDLMSDAIEQGVIVPGDPEASAVAVRIRSDDDRVRMPPPESHKVLNEKQKQLIVDWIEAGANYEPHWAFRPVRKPAIPGRGEGAASPAGSDAIDALVRARLKQEGLAFSPEADRESLLRRATFDLTGLPPTIEELDAFLNDTSPDAFAKVVDRLLASPRYGERMALGWLDAARYADTFGYQNDRETHVWPWRDWVIRAFNANMPYDQFVTEQLAGDLIENSTTDQRLATAFNRLHRQTNEGGSVEEEFRLEYVADRTEVFGTAMLGMTFECARCHDHKFDPTSQKEFFQLSAFFASIDESGMYSHFTETAPTPALMLYGEGQEAQHANLKRAIEERLAQLKSAERDSLYRFIQWLGSSDRAAPEPIVHLPFDSPEEKPGFTSAEGRFGGAAVFNGDGAVSIEKLAAFERSDPFTLAMHVNSAAHEPRMMLAHRSEASLDAASRGYELRLDDGHVVFGLIHFWPGNALVVKTREAIPENEWVHLAATYDGSSRAAGIAIYIDGKLAPLEIVRDGLYRTIRYGNGDKPNLQLGARFRDNGFKDGRIDEFRVYDAELSALEIESLARGVPLGDLIAKEIQTREGRARVREVFEHSIDKQLNELRGELHAARAEEAKFAETIPQIMVMQEMDEPRETHLLGRGSYLEKREVVKPDTPLFLPPFPEDAPRNRLGLAQWLFLPDHPLTARVAVNRLWAQLFGRGLVATPEDFGIQGEPPEYPDLLDYLAVRYRELGWDTKAMLREIMLSGTYRQVSAAPPELLQRDPENALLARGPRHRLSAEAIRDAALAASGLLTPSIGGPSVKPYQPEGIWKDVSSTEYKQDTGEALYRRSMYTFLKRTAPPPTMLLFDATDRETCVVRRERTETPLQALVLLNDPQFVEAARVLAERVMALHPGDPESAVKQIFRWLTSRTPSEKQMNVLLAAYAEQRAHFAAQPDGAAAYLQVGEHPADANLGAVELAAMTAIAQLAMNYDEFQMKR